VFGHRNPAHLQQVNAASPPKRHLTDLRCKYGYFIHLEAALPHREDAAIPRIASSRRQTPPQLQSPSRRAG